MRFFNTKTKKVQTFRPVRPDTVTVFTCGPSVYQRSHIGNFRTFLFEDVLVRYLAFSGYEVKRGMNFTDIEDKAIEEAQKDRISVKELTERNIAGFLKEMALLRMRRPEYLPRASECVGEAVAIIKKLLRRGIAYRYRGNIYFDPLKVRGFGSLYGLDMSKWPKEKRRFHKDTYPGTRWNLGDFILWHGAEKGEKDIRESSFGNGRPSWNIQDPAMVSKYFHETLSIYCGGIDNLYRHHDYSKAILEAVRPYPMARFWLHCRHLYVNGKKMSKSIGNIYYTDTILNRGYEPDELRFFLICCDYRETLDYSDAAMAAAASRLRDLKKRIGKLSALARHSGPGDDAATGSLTRAFVREMDNDLNVGRAFNAVEEILLKFERNGVSPERARGILDALKGIDEVLNVIF